MAVFEFRQRSGYLFLVVMLAHVLLISAQVNSRGGVPLLESVTFGVFSEIQRTVSTGFSSVRDVWSGYIGLRQVKRENDELKRRLATTEVTLQQQSAMADRARGLAQLLELRDRLTLRTVAAEIIGAGAAPDFRTLTIDKGTRDGLRPDMAVIAPAGIAGRVVIPSARSAKVQLLVDLNAAAGAMIGRTRAQGIVVGAGGDRLRMDYVSDVADVVVGDVVVSSGIDGIYPKGLVIGRVESIERSGGAYRRIIVRPAVDFSSLEEVLVVVTPTPAREAADGVSE